MKKLKQSILLKLFINLILFVVGYFLVYHIFYIYQNRYGTEANTSIEKFEDTEAFQKTYLKYIERVAEYVQYSEKGFTARNLPVKDLEAATNLDYFYSLDEDDYDQYIFEFYNQKLNINKTNFLYYVVNTTTDQRYYSPYFNTMAYDRKDDKDRNLVDSNLSNFVEQIEKQNSYVIINTASNYYASNIPYKEYINTKNLNWVVNCMKGTLSPEESQKRLNYQWESNSGSALNNSWYDNKFGKNEYLIYTAVVDGFPYDGDEFYTAYVSYQESTGKYMNAVKFFPILLGTFLLLFAGNIVIAGHSRKSKGIKLLWIDYVHTEIAALILIICFLLCFYAFFNDAVVRLLFYSLQVTPTISTAKVPLNNITAIMLYSPLYLISMSVFLSLVRRVKAKTIWTNSLIYWLYKQSKNLLTLIVLHSNLTFRVVAAIIMFVMIQSIGIYLLVTFKLTLLFLVIFILAYAFFGILLIRYAADLSLLMKETKKITEGDISHKTPSTQLIAPLNEFGADINNIGDVLSDAVDERIKSERLKAELITNVSHDIKTPLTSIINYVDLLSKENLENENAKGYLEILKSKSWRLKTLIEDLVEASKASTGTIPLNLERLNLVELIRQLLGEFEDRFVQRDLEINLFITDEPIYIIADGRSTFRIFENIFSNVNKYALSGTRVYVDINKEGSSVSVAIKNISANKLNITEEELMERFVRGDLSRNTEGSGLGLSIAKSLAALQNGKFEILLDGDLFKAICTFTTIE